MVATLERTLSRSVCLYAAASLAAISLLLVTAGPAATQELVFEDEEAARADPDALVDAAEQLIATGLFDQAETLLTRAAEWGADPAAVRFARAYMLQFRGDLSGAAELYRQILDEQPDALRVRLELGRVYYLLEDDVKANLQFRYALAGDLPEPVVDNVLAILELIRARRKWSVGLDLAIAPDTNINAAPNTRTVDVLGLPFVLDDEARRESGVGVEARLSGRYDVAVSPSVLFRQTASLRMLEYEGGTFDDTSVFVNAGPLFRSPGREHGVSLVVGRRWFSGRDYNRSIGMRADTTWRVGERLDVGVGARWLHLDHEDAKFLDGPRGQISADATYALSTQSFLRGVVAVDRERAAAATESNWGLFFALGLFTEIGGGFGVYVEPGVQLRRFDEKSATFGDRRVEISPHIGINFRNRRLNFFGFTPLVGIGLEKRFSTIDLFEYERARLVLGVTREF